MYTKTPKQVKVLDPEIQLVEVEWFDRAIAIIPLL